MRCADIFLDWERLPDDADADAGPTAQLLLPWLLRSLQLNLLLLLLVFAWYWLNKWEGLTRRRLVPPCHGEWACQANWHFGAPSLR